MGASRARRYRFLAQHPYCCYCGGAEPATTIDHVPSVQLFRQRQRPSGLEVPACKACNNKTGGHEQVAALLARMYPDAPTEERQVELSRLMEAVHRQNPLLLPELTGLSWTQQYDHHKMRHLLPRDSGIFNAGGPILNASMQIFCTKMVFALHYVKTGNIIPPAGGVAVRWFSNYDRLTGTLPDEWFKYFGTHETLAQGEWSVEDQFGYSWAIVPEGTAAMYFAYFGASFALIGFVMHDRRRFPNNEVMTIHEPGFARE